MSLPSPNEEDDAVWELLRQVQEHRASPLFARNVLREIRQAEERESLWRFWLSQWRYAIPATAAAVALCIGVFSDNSADSRVVVATNSVAAPFTVARIESDPDFEVIAELDTLLAYENNTQWLDSSLSN